MDDVGLYLFEHRGVIGEASISPFRYSARRSTRPGLATDRRPRPRSLAAANSSRLGAGGRSGRCRSRRPSCGPFRRCFGLAIGARHAIRVAGPAISGTAGDSTPPLMSLHATRVAAGMTMVPVPGSPHDFRNLGIAVTIPARRRFLRARRSERPGRRVADRRSQTEWAGPLPPRRLAAPRAPSPRSPSPDCQTRPTPGPKDSTASWWACADRPCAHSPAAGSVRRRIVAP